MVRGERKDAAEHRELIIRTARSLFAAHGVEEVSMHRIAKTCGVGQGTLYRRYANKADLVQDLIQDDSKAIIQEIRAYLNDHAAQPAIVRIEHVLNRSVAMIEDMVVYYHVIRQAPRCEGGLFVYRMPLYVFMQEILNTFAEEAGAKDPFYYSHAVLSSLNPALLAHLLKENGYTRERLVENLMEVYVRPLFR